MAGFVKNNRASTASALMLTLISTASAQAQTAHHSSSGNIVGDVCIGEDCGSVTAYDENVLMLRDENPRLMLDDSSVTAGYPSHDWGIWANDNVMNGAAHFSVRDVTNNETPFRITAGAGENAFHMTSGGQIGLGTETPLEHLHIVGSDRTALRLESHANRASQSFDLSTNGTMLEITDSSVPSDDTRGQFRMEAGARVNAMMISADSRIGIGTDRPQESIHVVSNPGESASFMLENTGNFGDGDGRWEFVMRKSDGEFAINDADTPGGDFIFTGPSDQVQGDTSLAIFNPTRGARWDLRTRGSDGDFEIDDDVTAGPDFLFRSAATSAPEGPGLTVKGRIFTTGDCSAGCDAVFDEDYDLPTIEDHAAAMFANNYLPTVGPTQSGEFDLTQKVLTMLNELEKAHIYIAQLNEEKKSMADRLAILEHKLSN